MRERRSVGRATVDMYVPSHRYRHVYIHTTSARALCRTQKRFRHDSRLAARSRLSDSFPLDAYTHAPHGATKAARPLR